MVRVVLRVKSGSLNDDLFFKIRSAVRDVVEFDEMVVYSNDSIAEFYADRDQANNYGIRLKEMLSEVISYEIAEN